MSIWRFILIDSDGVETEVDNPQGWESPEVNIDRDDTWHGIFFGYSFGQLKFIGTAFTLIKQEYDTKGVNGDMSLKILYQCSEDGQFDVFYEGRLSFDEYSDECGSECSVTIGLEDSTDVMLLRNNYEQKVNLNSNIAFDEETELTNYNYLNFDLGIPSRGIPIKSVASDPVTYTFVVDDVDDISVGAVYTNNESQFTISGSNLVGGVGTIQATRTDGTNSPEASGTLVKFSGSGDSGIDYTSFSTSSGFELLDYPTWNNISGSGSTGTEQGALMPMFENIEFSEIDQTNINAGPYYDTSVVFNNGENSIGTPPFIDLQKNQQLKCSPSSFRMKYRIKGRLKDVSNATRIVDMNLIVRIGSSPANTFLVSNQILASYEAGAPITTEFDVSYDDFPSVNTGDKIYFFAIINYVKTSSAVLQSLVIEFDPENSISFTGISYCEATNAKSYMINEAVSRTVEAITSDKIRFYSTYFGRIDSQPYSLLSQTCGGLFAISSGLNVRRRTLADGSQPGCFVTLKQLFDDLNAIWNIGLSIEPDKFRPGFNFIRFEDWRYFYQDEVGIIFNDASSVKRDVDKTRLFNRMAVGYNKWKAEQFSGLDELMTEREYRLNINAISNPLEVKSDMITAPYTTEITRRLDTGTDDWQYDNDIFAFCLKGEGSPAEYSVETFADVAFGVENVNDPDTCYNGRISPVRNAMRWFNYIMQGLRQLQVDSKMIFTKGTGNYVAKFGLNDCNIEGQPIAENESIETGDFDDQDNAKPITFPEIIRFDHPLNYNLFKRIKNEPTLKFKSIVVRCNGNDIHGWIKNISYRPEEGMATITAIPKNTTQLPSAPPEDCSATVTPGSVTMGSYDFNAKTAEIDFTEGSAGATLWYYIVTQGATPGSGTGFSGTTTSHPFTVSGITPGQWSVMVVPYCSETQVGQNYGYGTFDMPSPDFTIELSAVLTNFGSNNHLILTAHSVGDVPAPGSFSFQWGQCVVNTSVPIEACRAYPGSAIPTPTNTLNFNAGQTTVSQQSVTVTAGQSYGYITKVVLHNLSGIAGADIVKADGQGWTLEIQ